MPMQDDLRPQRLWQSTRWCRYAALREEPCERGVRVYSERPGYAASVLSPVELRIAKIFDGERTPEQRVTLANSSGEVSWTLPQMEGFAAQLAQAGLLYAGTHEPVPVPAYTQAEARQLGWTGEAPGLAGAAIAVSALPPSSVPGARGSPGLAQALDGPLSGHALAVPTPALIVIGRPFNLALHTQAGLTTALLAALAALVVVYTQRHAYAQDWAHAWHSGMLGLHLFVAIAAIHLSAVAARAHAISRYARGHIRCGWRLGFLRMPYLTADSEGAFERADRDARLRLIAASLLASVQWITLATLAWRVFAPTLPGLSQFAAVLSGVAVFSVLLRLNPLARREGYRLLSHAIRVPDLREQAMVALFGFERPWYALPRKLSRRALLGYAMLCIVFVVAMLAFAFTHLGAWLAARFGGIGFLFFAALVGAYMFRQLTKDRIAAARGTLGWKRDWKLTRRQKMGAAIVLILCCFPYRYEPSGDLVVLPNERADVRALVAGDVREVLVQEGDEVKAGQVIARLRDDEARSRVAQAEATLAQLQADLALYKRGAKTEEVEVARQRVAVARKRAQVSRDNAARLKQAYDKQSITAFEYDRARGSAEVDEQSLLEAERALELTASPAMVDQITAREAQVKGAAATLQYSREQLADTEIKAPIAGRIVSGSLRFAVGTFLERGALLATVENSKELIAEIRLPESAIAEIKPGNGASAKVWAYPGSTFEGRVSSVAPAAEQGTYGKVVRVQMTLQDPEGRLKPEMTGSAKAEGDRHLAIVVFTRAIARFVMIEVWSWLP